MKTNPEHTKLMIKKGIEARASKTFDQRAEEYASTVYLNPSTYRGDVETAYVFGCMQQQEICDQQTAELRAEVERLKEELDGTNMLYKQAIDAAGSYEQRAREAETEIRHIYDRPNINHP